MLDDVAKIILKDRYDEFTSIREKFLDGEDLAAVDPELGRLVAEDAAEDTLLWAFAHCVDCIQWIDWSGEEDPEQLQRFVDQRMRKLKGVNLDWSFLDDFNRKIDFNKLQRGDCITKKLTCLDTELRKFGYMLALFDQGDDQYYPFVVSVDEFPPIDGIELGLSQIKAWSDA